MIKSVTHPNFKDVYIEMYSRSIYTNTAVKIKMRWMNRAGYPIENTFKWVKVPLKFYNELILYKE